MQTPDSAAVIFFSSNYQPYGVGHSMSGVEEFMYTGKLPDAITGLYHFGAYFHDEELKSHCEYDVLTIIL